MRVEVRNFILVLLGWMFVLMGFVGAFLPVLPTVPFMIAAAACFSKGSPKLHAWLLRRKRLGPAIRLWEEHKVIPPFAKKISTFMICSGIGFSITIFEIPRFAQFTMVAVGLLAIVFIWKQKDEILSEPPLTKLGGKANESESSKAMMK